MIDVKRKVSYRWVPRDAENWKKLAPAVAPATRAATWADYESRRVTPYGFVREMLPGYDRFQAGDLVSIDLSKSTLYPFEVRSSRTVATGMASRILSSSNVAGSKSGDNFNGSKNHESPGPSYLRSFYLGRWRSDGGYQAS